MTNEEALSKIVELGIEDGRCVYNSAEYLAYTIHKTAYDDIVLAAGNNWEECFAQIHFPPPPNKP